MLKAHLTQNLPQSSMLTSKDAFFFYCYKQGVQRWIFFSRQKSCTVRCKASMTKSSTSTLSLSTLYLFAGDENAAPLNAVFSAIICRTIRSPYPVASAVLRVNFLKILVHVLDDGLGNNFQTLSYSRHSQNGRLQRINTAFLLVAIHVVQF